MLRTLSLSALAVSINLAYSPFAAAALPELGSVVITASRSPQPLETLTGDFSVIDAEQIATSGQSTVVDLLRSLPGVEVSSQGGPGQPATLFLRGANSNHTVVLIDGVRQTTLNIGLGSLQSLPLGAIERIEILRGPASGLYGADAIGGVIHIISKAAGSSEKPLAGTVSAGAGSNGQQRADVVLSGRQNAVSWMLNVGEERSKGFDATTRKNFAHDPDDDAQRNRYLNLNLALDLSENHRLDMKWLDTRNHVSIDSEFPPFVTAPKASATEQIENLSATLVSRLSSTWTSTLQLSQNTDRFRWDDTNSFDDQVINKADLISWQNDVVLGAHRLRLAAEQLDQSISSVASSYGKHERKTDSLLAGYVWQGAEREFRADLRHDRVVGFGNVDSGNLGASQRLTPNLTLDVRYGEAFKLPTFNDLYYVDPWGMFVPNPTLTPEKGRTVEAGLLGRWQGGDASVYLFQTRISNLIANVDPDGFLGPLPGTVANTGLAKIQGVSAHGGTVLSDWTLKAALTVQEARDAATDDWLPRRARIHGSASAERTSGALNYALEIQGQGKRFDSLPNGTNNSLDAYTLAHLRVRYALSPDLSLNARINNLFDTAYELAQGYANPGRNVFVGLSYRLP